MADRPILFSAPMVRALLDGRKTQTRRIAKFVEPDGDGWHIRNSGGGMIGCDDDAVVVNGPDYAPFAIGDRLWVKETWNVFGFSQDGEVAWPLPKIPSREQFEEVKELAVRGDWQIIHRESDRAREWFADQKWRVSIHMPRFASRLTLTVTDVRVERLQDISEADAICEGIYFDGIGYTAGHMGMKGCNQEWSATPRIAFANLWRLINGAESWEANPWVAATSFTVEQRNIDA